MGRMDVEHALSAQRLSELSREFSECRSVFTALAKLSVEAEKLASEWNAALEGGMRRPFRSKQGDRP